ncbi:KIR protein [Plasmodium coatneyi]|uniref:KIR protein n=1 Tax=Plasmodium coatneyi TaxID=208452 RepID=A0A1B1DXA2_9APIC|nr:KIR protein [Plasmodium coatneyi]ANQ07413.1 KIR protein [Plasmodium coatneyi]
MRIVGSCCYALNMRVSDDIMYKERCNLLYYWLGEKMREQLQDSQFKQAISVLYNILQNPEHGWNCTDIYRDISWDVFERKKKIFDYEYNKKVLTEKSNCSAYLSNSKYDQCREDAEEAYDWFCKHCGDMTNDSYCKKFIQNYGKGMPCKQEKLKKLPQLTCVSAPAAAKPRTLAEKDPLDELDSRKIYNRLDQYQQKQCAQTDFAQEIRNILNGANLLGETIVKEIINTLCYISRDVEDDDSENDQDNTFFYYWMGEKLSTILGDAKFKEVMNKCKSEVESNMNKYNCDFVDTPNSINVFEAFKTVYDYYYDRNCMERTLGTGHEDCADPYYKYLLRAQDAYRIMEAECTGSNSSKWCEKFGSSYGECKSGKKVNEECRVKSISGKSCIDDSEAETSTFLAPKETSSGTSSEGSNITPAISAAGLALVGLPMATFFLYKYNLLPDWFHNTFKGERRNIISRRSIERNTDVLTDDTSTEYSADSATAGSTVDSILDDSTLYSAPITITPKRRSNRKELRNIRYGSM